ncbi:MAG: glycosyltransferase [Clostridia bacterium]|nr:glycosyltransferase [Clostridia bacterium]
MKTTGIIVTYRRYDLLKKNLEACLNQNGKLDALIIVDNCSKDGTVERLRDEYGNNKEIIVYELQENTGGAGGFYHGLKYAYDLGYDCCILMDDDGRPFDNNTFEKLLNTYYREYVNGKPMMLNSIVICDEANLTFGLSTITTIDEATKAESDGLIMNQCNLFNGTLVNRELIELIGFPNKDFFIRFDEVDYFNRALDAGAFVATIVDSRYFHPTTSDKSVKKYLGIRFENEYEAPWKEYYKVRNKFYLYKQNGKNSIWIFLKFLQYMLGVMLFDVKDRKNVLNSIRLGYKHAKRGKLGKVIEPGQKVINIKM